MPNNKEHLETVEFRGYFQGHECHLASDKLSAYYIKCGRFRSILLNMTTLNQNDIRAQNMYRSHAALCAERYRQFLHYPLSIHPFSKLRYCLEFIFFISMFVSNIFVAYHFSTSDVEHDDICNNLMIIFDILYIFNVISNFFTGYVEGDSYKHVVLDLNKIACKYLRSWLIVDLLSALCFITEVIHLDDIKPLLIMVSMRILRLPVLLLYARNIMTVLKVQIFKQTTMEILILIISYLSWNIYFQFSTEYWIEGSFKPNNPRKCSWISVGKLWNATTITRFIYALDRAVACVKIFCTSGCLVLLNSIPKYLNSVYLYVGMLRKNSNLTLVKEDVCFEDFYIVSWIIAKFLVLHCALKYIISLFGSESAQAKYYIMTKQVENYMNQRKFPPRIKKKILKFYAIRFQRKFFEESRMLDCVSGQLKEDIILHTSRQCVSELEFLKQLPRTLLLEIGLKLRLVIFIAGDIIFKIKTVGDCLYFIDKGTVAIYSESGKEICHLEDGDLFGEIALVLNQRFRTASAVAVSNCELFRLDKEDFDSSIACYPTVYDDIKRVATKRYERTCVLDEHHKTETKMYEKHKYRDPNESY